MATNLKEFGTIEDPNVNIESIQPKPSISLKEIQLAKETCKLNILKCLTEFENTTGLCITSIDYNVKSFQIENDDMLHRQRTLELSTSI